MRLDKLDLVRGLAAFAVFLGHQRAFLLVEYSQVQSPNALINVFYAITGFGHQAVVIFFVLSGYLIGGAVHERFSSNRWSFRDYAIRRITRLWVVLIPALLFTWIWDAGGNWLSGGAGYDGRYYERNHLGPSVSEPADHSLLTFFLNAVFLQKIVGPTYGSNGPLWSLANEFWYYLMFPLGFSACASAVPARTRWVCATILTALVFALPMGLVIGGLLWLAGYGAYLIARSPLARLAASATFFWTATLALAGVLVWNRWRGLPYSEYWEAVTFAGVLPRLARDRGGAGWCRRLARYVGSTSYTLYVFHFPFLAFVAFGILDGLQWQPTSRGFSIYAGVTAITLVWVHSAWWVFERHTETFRQIVGERLSFGRKLT